MTLRRGLIATSWAAGAWSFRYERACGKPTGGGGRGLRLRGVGQRGRHRRGAGQLATAILERHPHVDLTVLELPNVVERARTSGIATRYGERLRFVPGSFFDEVPSGARVYVLSNILHDWSDEDAASILERAREAMLVSSELVIIEQIVSPEPRVQAAHIVDLVMMGIFGGRPRSVTDFSELLAEAGLDLDEVRDTASTASVMTARRSA